MPMYAVLLSLWVVAAYEGLFPSLSSAQLSITEYDVPTANAHLVDITAGPDGNVWFTERDVNRVGRITPAGVITEYVAPTPDSLPNGIASGPDGNLWFTEQGANKIARITPTGSITEFAIPTANSYPTLITAGPDGNLWFTEHFAGKIGRITPTGIVTEYPIPSGGMPLDITTGPDGKIWFTNFSTHQIGTLTTDGVFTEYAVPTPNSGPFAITPGPDGNVWFTERYANQVGVVTPAGEFIEYATPTAGDLVGIVAAADGNLWFTEYNGNKLGRITPDGTVTEYDAPTPGAGLHHITGSALGDLWLTEKAVNRIANVRLERPTPTPTATPPADPTATATVSASPTPEPTATAHCGSTPDPLCRGLDATPRSQILLKDRIPDENDLVSWRWSSSAATLKADFGDPTSTTSYSFCVYDERGGMTLRLLAALIPAGRTCDGDPCWKETARGFRFRDDDASNEGIVSVVMRQGLGGRASINVQGKGPALGMPSLPLEQDTRVVVQLASSDGTCWGSAFTRPAVKSTQAEFRDKLH